MKWAYLAAACRPDVAQARPSCRGAWRSSLDSALPELIVMRTTVIQAPVHIGCFRKLTPGRPRGRRERYPEQDADNRYTHAVRIDIPAEQPADEIARPFDDDFGYKIKQHVSDEAEHTADDFAGDFSEGHVK